MQDKPTLADQIMHHAMAEAGAIAGEACRLLDCAVRDGDILPAVVVTVKVTVSRDGDRHTIDRKATAERKQVSKSDGESVEWNPNEPGLPGLGD
jgi:hypothetical protein